VLHQLDEWSVGARVSASEPYSRESAFRCERNNGDHLLETDVGIIDVLRRLGVAISVAKAASQRASGGQRKSQALAADDGLLLLLMMLLLIMSRVHSREPQIGLWPNRVVAGLIPREL
jgi:hypothetical protein